MILAIVGNGYFERFLLDLNISARNRTQDLNNMSSALPLSYWNIDKKRWCSCHVSSTGCKHSSVIDMNGHQGIWASLASNKKQLLNSRQVTLNPLAFLFEFYIYESVVQYKTPSLTGVENKINEGKDNQSINQSSINQSSINQVSRSC